MIPRSPIQLHVRVRRLPGRPAVAAGKAAGKPQPAAATICEPVFRLVFGFARCAALIRETFGL